MTTQRVPARVRHQPALTIWQPWASLIMIGAKPAEFRRWDYRARYRGLEGRRIVIHAGARAIMRHEVDDIIERLADRVSSLNAERALPLLNRLRGAYKCQGILPLGAALGTAILRTPKQVSALFNSPADSDRIDHHMWAWPLDHIEPFSEPIPCRGMQGFWEWPYRVGEAA